MKIFSIALLVLCFTLNVNAENASILLNAKMLFWQKQGKGANIFNEKMPVEIVKAAKKYNIQFIRLACDKWPSKRRDFLIGDADHYSGLVVDDLKQLKQVLDLFHQEGIPVVLTMLSLPGSRWKQNNNNLDDVRLWKDQHFQIQAAKFWQDLARELKGHPAIVGYDILNEPHPEKVHDHNSSVLQRFYLTVIAAIREADQVTPIIIESSNYADPQQFRALEPVADPAILYSFHFYEPFSYTNRKMNQGRFEYPGLIPDNYRAKPRLWNKQELSKFLDAVRNFQKKHAIPSHQILVGEFGGHRFSKGLERYFTDLTSIFNTEKWHFAVYAFQEDTWDGMDYECGQQKLPWGYWKAIESGQKEKVKRFPDNPLFKILRKEWNAS